MPPHWRREGSVQAPTILVMFVLIGGVAGRLYAHTITDRLLSVMVRLPS